MNEILINTHVKENIDLLKARDFYFDKARKRYKWYEFTIILPPLIAGISYVPFLIRLLPFLDEYRDHIVGICTILFVIIGELILKKNEADLTVSNALREEYDVQVFGIERNRFAISEDTLKKDDKTWKDEIVSAWNSRKSISKYEVWYQEVFCSHKRRNILCFQLDNIIYTYHIYNAYRKKLKQNMIIGSVLIGALFLCSVLLWKNIQVFFLIMFSLFGALQYQLGNIKNIKELLSSIDHIYTTVLNDSEKVKELLDDDVKGAALLRTVQDVAIIIRERSLFVPKSIRNRYLKNGNDFYVQLDHIKQTYMEDPYIPDKAEDIDILSSQGSKVTATIADVHKRLFEMLKDVDKVFREENVGYTMDGGSLIGACRDEKGFVFWDDDVDLALMIDDVEKAEQVIRERLGDKYDVQDYFNEEAYSPRLSNFRVRERSRSELVEKDSELYEAYESKGLFLDIYAYAPIVCNRFIDRIVRRVLIQGFRFRLKDLVPLKRLYAYLKKKDRFITLREKMETVYGFRGLYERIRKAESDWKYDAATPEKKKKHYAKFLKLKKKYLHRINIYRKLAKNSEYCCYIPNYIDDICIPGPYIKRSALQERTETDFHFEDTSLKVMIPQGYDAVLTAFYGNWRTSPFVPLESLKKEDGYEFSSRKFDVTALKHMQYIKQF